MSQASPEVPDAEKIAGSAPTSEQYTPDDDACFKLWNVYISQAFSYDKALLEGWKSDMDGIIIFSALYSASLTAFIIESYQTLQEDPADTTVFILTQISRQLASLSNGTAMAFQDPPSFALTTPSLVCNTLWFLSLALALTCSLLATLVQQWTRDFIHRTTMRSSPVIQARVLAFLYFGLQRSGMHTFVDVIPILLHISLLFFFAGLVAFLSQINHHLTYLMACVLAVFVLVYMGLSCLPLMYLDAPYRTPISGLCWRLGNMFHSYKHVLRKRQPSDSFTLTDAMLRKALKSSTDRDERDRRCMDYTMESLNHDTELLPMFEAIPEAALDSSDRGRLVNLKIILPILESSDSNKNIISRISDFISVSGRSVDPIRQEQDMKTSLKALWSLACLAIQYTRENRSSVSWFNRSLLDMLRRSESVPKCHLISTLALVRTSRLQKLKHCIDTVAIQLSFSSKPAPERIWMAHDTLSEVSSNDIDWCSEMFKHHFDALRRTLQEGYTASTSESRSNFLVKGCKKHLTALQRVGRWKAALISILGEFLGSAASSSGVMPFQMNLTYKLICSSMQELQIALFDQSVEVEDDEATSSYHPLQVILPDSEVVPPELFTLAFNLLCTTNQGLFLREHRRTIIAYMFILSTEQTAFLLRQDPAGLLDQSLLQNLREEYPVHPSRSVTVVGNIYAGLGHTTGISPRLYVFVKQIFDITLTASPLLTQARWWNSMKIHTEWLLCKHILFRLGDLANTTDDDIQAILVDTQTLGERLLPDVALQSNHSLVASATLNRQNTRWAENLRAFVMSMTLLVISETIDLCTEGSEDVGDVLFFDWYGMQYDMFNYSGRVYNTVQAHFAKSVHKLVFLTPWKHPRSSLASQAFHERIWRLSVVKWCWITDLESAKLLSEAILYHHSHPDSRGSIWREQELYDRCAQVIQEAGADR